MTDELHRAKVRRRLLEDDQQRRAAAASTARLGLNAWHWVQIGSWDPGEPLPDWAWALIGEVDRRAGRRPRFVPGRVLRLEEHRVLVGYAVAGTTQWVRPQLVGRRLSPAEMSDHLRREPVRRDWPDPDPDGAG